MSHPPNTTSTSMPGPTNKPHFRLRTPLLSRLTSTTYHPTTSTTKPSISGTNTNHTFKLLAVLIFLILYILNLSTQYRRIFDRLESCITSLLTDIKTLQSEIASLREERERREVVLRREVGKAREEIQRMGRRWEEALREVVGVVERGRVEDRDEKLCLIEGLRSVATMRCGERGSSLGEGGFGDGVDLRGVGCGFDRVGMRMHKSDESEGSSTETETEAEEGYTVSEISEDCGEKTRLLRKEAREAWNIFDGECESVRCQTELRDRMEELKDDQSQKILIVEPENGVFLGVEIADKTQLEIEHKHENQGERLFGRGRRESDVGQVAEVLVDPEVREELDAIFELE